MSQNASELRLEDLPEPYLITNLSIAGIESVFDLSIKKLGKIFLASNAVLTQPKRRIAQ
jgi:hypothetical protein